MRILLDECLPRQLARLIDGHDVQTAAQMGFAGKSNGDLLRSAAGKIDCFVTVDANLAHQNQLSALPFGVIILRAPSNRLADLQGLIFELTATLATLQPGQIVLIPQEPPA
jgi:predicted nuclease of predicted toxin-antitoxin system